MSTNAKLDTKAVFGAVIATVMLGLYVYLVVVALRVLGCTPVPGCRSAFTGDMAASLPLLGGLVAAPIIAELAIAKRGEVPLQRVIGMSASANAKLLLNILVLGYFVVWMGVGLLALIASWRHPAEVEALTTLGKSWLGLAVAAGYAYFGVTPPGS